MKLPPEILRTLEPQPEPTRCLSSLGFAGRSEMLGLWDRLDAADQQALLIIARGLAKAQAGRAEAEDGGPAERVGKR